MSYFDNIQTFVRVYELGNMSAAARDMRISAAVASARISQLEDHLGVRLFQRTTRVLNPTEQGNIFYPNAQKILDAVALAEAEINEVTLVPRGTIHVSAPLGVGRRLIAPLAPEFQKDYPLIQIRLRLSDRRVDLALEGVDVAFFLGIPEDSSLRIRSIADCPRVLCAAPAYLEKHGEPTDIDDLKANHACLNLRYPGAPEFQWPLQTKTGVQQIEVSGPLECDDGDILTDWALAGHGIILKPRFEVADYIRSGALRPVMSHQSPLPVQMACLYSHRRHQDPKTRLFIDFLAARMAAIVAGKKSVP
ncbi:MAG: LysR family transcriptional regulator [Pseudorhodobacter sp.]|nr:LysR family transcriptional regulator [Pseudorhodobacter sp.]